MALVTPSSRTPADATRRPEHAHVPVFTPSGQRPNGGHVDEDTLREYVRIELLVARARAQR